MLVGCQVEKMLHMYVAFGKCFICSSNVVLYNTTYTCLLTNPTCLVTLYTNVTMSQFGNTSHRNEQHLEESCLN